MIHSHVAPLKKHFEIFCHSVPMIRIVCCWTSTCVENQHDNFPSFPLCWRKFMGEELWEKSKKRVGRHLRLMLDTRIFLFFSVIMPIHTNYTRMHMILAYIWHYCTTLTEMKSNTMNSHDSNANQATSKVWLSNRKY